MKSKKITIIFVAILLISFVIYILPRPINVEMSGFEMYLGEEQPAIKRDIIIDGWHKSSLIGKDKFMGTIMIDDIKLPINEFIELGQKHGNLLYLLNESGDISTYGSCFFDDYYSKLMILVSKMEENGRGVFGVDKGSILIAPANTLNEAKSLANEMLLKTLFKDIHFE